MMVLLAGLSGGCDQAPPAPARPAPTFGNATITGTVKFTGTPPAMARINNQPCHAGATELTEETVVVGENGALANVVVALAGISASDGKSQPPTVLDQVNCRYVPHVVAVQTGQPLDIRTSDPAVHNVHYVPQKNTAANFSQTNPGDSRRVTFDHPETFRVRCDVHPWMTAYIAVIDNPFFAVTKLDGTFQIPKVPAGHYRLVAWHERYGTLEQPITIAENSSVTTDFVYKPPTDN